MKLLSKYSHQYICGRIPRFSLRMALFLPRKTRQPVVPACLHQNPPTSYSSITGTKQPPDMSQYRFKVMITKVDVIL